MDEIVSNLYKSSPFAGALIACFYMWLKTRPKKWDGKRDRREHLCLETKTLQDLRERIKVIEVKEHERNLEVQEFKKSFQSQLTLIQENLNSGFKENRDIYLGLLGKLNSFK